MTPVAPTNTKPCDRTLLNGCGGIVPLLVRLAPSRIAEKAGRPQRSPRYVMLAGMKSEKTAPKIEDIELHPDAWDPFVRAVKQVAKHPPVEHPTGHGKGPKSQKQRGASRRR